MDTYRIKDWDDNFEIAQSRKCAGMKMSWVSIPNKHEGEGYNALKEEPKRVEVFCAWVLLVQTASKMPVRGVLEDKRGPLTSKRLALRTGFPEEIFELAFEVLTDDKIGWLEIA